MAYTTPLAVTEGDSFDESTWNTYIKDNFDFVFDSYAAAFGFSNPLIALFSSGVSSVEAPVTSYQWAYPSTSDWPFVREQVRVQPNTQYLAHCGFTWTVTTGGISEIGLEVVAGDAPTLGGTFTYQSVGAATYDRGGKGYPSSALLGGTLATTGLFVSGSGDPAVALNLSATVLSSTASVYFTNIYFSLKALKQA